MSNNGGGEKSSGERKKSLALKLAQPGLATMGACFFSNPIEVMKTRLQLQGELQAAGQYQKAYKNVFHALYVVGKNEGIRGVQKGLGLGLAYQGIMNGARLGSFDFVKDSLSSNGYTLGTVGTVGLAASCGALGAALGSPLFLIKTQQQSYSGVKGLEVGNQVHHKNAFDAARKIVAKEGVKGLYRGVSGAIPRVMVGSSSQLLTYGKCKGLAKRVFPNLKDGLQMHFFCSMVAGGAVALAMNPFDVVSVRLYNQPVDNNGKGKLYSGYTDVVKKLYQAEGPFGFYKGIGALYLRIGPHTILTFVFWEQIKMFFEGKTL